MKKRSTHKAVTAVTLAITLVVMSAVAVFAYLRWSSSVTNTFTPDDEVDPTILETLDTDNNEKENVSINVGNNAVTNDTGYSVYVRAAIVVTWVKANDPKQVLATPPKEGVDYSIDLTTDDADATWFKGTDGFYYYEEAVASGGETADLIDLCQPIKKAPVDGYVLNVRIISQTIQALGTTDGGNVPAVKDAWGVVKIGDDGKLVSDPNP